MLLRPGIPTGRGSGLKHRPVWVRIPPGAHNEDMKVVLALVALGSLVILTGCSSTTETPEVAVTGAQFESDNPDANVFTDDAGNELQVGDDLPIPLTGQLPFLLLTAS